MFCHNGLFIGWGESSSVTLLKLAIVLRDLTFIDLISPRDNLLDLWIAYLGHGFCYQNLLFFSQIWFPSVWSVSIATDLTHESHTWFYHLSGPKCNNDC